MKLGSIYTAHNNIGSLENSDSKHKTRERAGGDTIRVSIPGGDILLHADGNHKEVNQDYGDAK